MEMTAKLADNPVATPPDIEIDVEIEGYGTITVTFSPGLDLDSHYPEVADVAWGKGTEQLSKEIGDEAISKARKLFKGTKLN